MSREYEQCFDKTNFSATSIANSESQPEYCRVLCEIIVTKVRDAFKKGLKLQSV